MYEAHTNTLPNSLHDLIYEMQTIFARELHTCTSFMYLTFIYDTCDVTLKFGLDSFFMMPEMREKPHKIMKRLIFHPEIPKNRLHKRPVSLALPNEKLI